MRKFLLLLTPLAFLLTACLFSSCKDDDEPSAPPQVSMEDEEIEVDEGDGSIEVKLSINPAPANDIIIYYDLGGSAQEGADYEIDGESGEVEVSAGQTEAVIKINIINDDNFEQNETIVIELDEVDAENVIITNEDQTTITILNDDESITASFAESQMVINEADNSISVSINLDKTFSSDIILEYEIGGNAVDSLTGFNEEIPVRYWDYFIDGTSGSITIPAGQTSATIDLEVFSDFTFDDGDSIVFTLKANNNVTIGTNKSITIYIQQEDGTAIFLEWERSQVDMDLVLWINEDGEDFPIAAELWKDDIAETMVIPKVIDDVSFGTSYVYYSGGTGDLDFSVTFAEIDNHAFEPEAGFEVFTATYTEANKNVWTESQDLTWQIVQRFEQVDGEITNIQPITVPSNGSRMKMTQIPFKFRSNKNLFARPLRAITSFK